MNLKGQGTNGGMYKSRKKPATCDKSCTISSPIHSNNVMKDTSYSVVHTSFSTQSSDSEFYIDINTDLSLSSIKGRCFFVLLVKT